MGAKLIRDRMGDIPWEVEAAKGLLRRPNNAHEHGRLLIQKLLEEVGELVAAESTKDMTNEIADVMEVLEGLATWHDIGDQEVQAAKRARYVARGGFQDGLVWDV